MLVSETWWNMDGLSQQDLPPLTGSKGTALIMSLYAFSKDLGVTFKFIRWTFLRYNEFLYSNGLLMFVCLYVISDLKIQK